jgi:hypothetical protein
VPNPPLTGRRALLTAGTLALALLAGLSAAPPKGAIYNAWNALNPGSTSDANVENGTGKVCQLCHRDESGGNPWNAYGWQIRGFIQAGSPTDDAILAAEAFDSDADPTGTSNIDEIAANTQPGWTPGPNNTVYFANGSTSTGQLPPAGILGDLDPQPAVGSWSDLGQALACTPGPPTLSGTGDLLAGTPVTLTLAGMLPNSTVYLVTGLVPLNAPFKGGVLVPSPSPPGFFVVLPTGPTGTVPLASTWPAGLPAAFSLYFQGWVLDAGGPVGFAASNALQATTP